MGESLELKLKRLEQAMADAEWEGDINIIVALEYEIRMTKYRLSTGQTHDQEF